MNRLILLICFVSAGLVLIAFGLTIPAHLRAVQARVILQDQPGNPSLVDEGLSLVSQSKVGPATLLWQAAYRENMPEAARLQGEIQQFASRHPGTVFLGGIDPYLPALLKPKSDKPVSQPIADVLILRDSRQAVLQFLGHSTHPAMARLLAIRTMTNTVHFSPVNSASGQPLETAILLAGLLLHQNQLSVPLRDRIEFLASRARWDNNLEVLESMFLDLLSVGRHLTWIELSDFVSRIHDPETLQRLAAQVSRCSASELPALFSAVHLSSAPAKVATYLNRFENTGLADLSFSLRAGKNGLRALLDRQQRIHRPGPTMVSLASRNPFLTQLSGFDASSHLLCLIVKIAFLAGGALCIAFGLAHSFPSGEFSVTTFWMPEIIFALAFLTAAIFLTEPFLIENTQPSNLPFQWKFPTVGGPLRAAIEKKVNPMVDTLSIASLSLFLVIQVIIYIFCRRKLAEIQRQTLPSKLKLRLLENEEHLFDAGLYVGFVGTVLSLVCVSIGIIKPSLMAAYSSTSFGIIFVTILKIFYLRPYRKELIIESETPAQ